MPRKLSTLSTPLAQAPMGVLRVVKCHIFRNFLSIPPLAQAPRRCLGYHVTQGCLRKGGGDASTEELKVALLLFPAPCPRCPYRDAARRPYVRAAACCSIRSGRDSVFHCSNIRTRSHSLPVDIDPTLRFESHSFLEPYWRILKHPTQESKGVLFARCVVNPFKIHNLSLISAHVTGVLKPGMYGGQLVPLRELCNRAI